MFKSLLYKRIIRVCTEIKPSCYLVEFASIKMRLSPRTQTEHVNRCNLYFYMELSICLAELFYLIVHV